MNGVLGEHLQRQQDRSTRLRALINTMAVLEAEGWGGGDEFACLLQIAREVNDALNTALDTVTLSRLGSD